MIAILEKLEHNIDFNQIVDFIEASHISPKSTGFNEFSSNIATAVVCFATNMGEGSTIPTEPHHIPSPQEQQSLHNDPSSPSHPTATSKQIPIATPTKIPTLRQYSRRVTWIAQSKAFSIVTDEPASLLRDDSQGKAFPTARIKLLKDKERGRTEPAQEDALIKGRSLKIGEEVRVERSTELGINDTKEMVNVLSSMEAANILTNGVATVSVPPVARVLNVGVPTVSGLVPTVSAIFTTASMVTPYSRRPRRMLAKDKEELKMLINGLDRRNEVIAKHLQEYEQSEAELTIGEKIELINELTKHFRGMKLEELREKFITVWKQFEDFVHMASKEEGERVNRKGLKLEHGSAKKMKTSKEVSEEDLKEMMQLVHVEEVYVEALQVKHPIIDWEIHSEGKKDYWKIIRLGGHTTVYQFFVDMLKQFDREDLQQLWALVKETLSIRHASVTRKRSYGLS
nr:hypothetical protein [Tanacetum cinerariifolium]